MALDTLTPQKWQALRQKGEFILPPSAACGLFILHLPTSPHYPHLKKGSPQSAPPACLLSCHFLNSTHDLAWHPMTCNLYIYPSPQ